MATKISAVMTVTDTANKQASKSITDISPNASDGQVKNFLTALNALTTNTIDGIELVTKKDITDATAKTPLTLTLSGGTGSLIKLVTNGSGDEVFNQGNLPNFTYKVEGTTASLNAVSVSFFKDSGSIYFNCYGDAGTLTSETQVTATLYFEETETTLPAVAQLVITKDNDPTLTIL